MKYDFFVGGRWRNFKNIQPVADELRKAGKKVYCFVENEYDGHGVKNERNPKDVESLMKQNEALENWQNNPTFRKIFETDMSALKSSKAIVVVFPFGFSAHMELGVAYGMGKKCYGVGVPEKAETLYFMFNKIFPTVTELARYIS
jgi:hypothetical protein